MPRLPTILVIGSQAISTMPVSSAVVIAVSLLPGLLEAGQELVALLAPLGLLVGRPRGEAPERPDDRAVHAARRRRDPCSWWLVHERHELVREARHRAGDADATHVGAAAHTVDPATLGDVAFDHRPPAAQLDQALGRAILGGEVALLVVAGPVTALMHGRAEQPGRPQRLIQRDHRCLARHLVQQVKNGLGQVVRVDRAARDADDRQAGLGPPVPAEVVGHAHGTRRVAGHRVDAPVGGTGANGEDGGRPGRQPVKPFAGRHRLAGRRVVAETAPVALWLDGFVRDGTLHHQHERFELTAVGLVPPLDEVVGPGLRTALEVDQRPVHRDLGQPRQGAEHDLLDAWLGRRGQGDRVPVTAKTAVHPEDVNNRFGGFGLRGHSKGHLLVSGSAADSTRSVAGSTRSVAGSTRSGADTAYSVAGTAYAVAGRTRSGLLARTTAVAGPEPILMAQPTFVMRRRHEC